MMIDPANRTFICSVVFVDLVGYSKKSVAEQISIKDRFTALLSDSLKNIAINDRIILDTGDGAAMSFLGDPEDALFVAMNLRDALKTPLADGAAGRDEEEKGIVCIGINLGPVKLVKDINGHPNIIGDGINVAQRIMSFAKPGQIVVSRSYYDVVSVISDAYAKLFLYEGSRTDKHVREHEIYVVGQSDAAFLEAKSGMENRAAQTNPKGRKASVGNSTGTYGMPAFNPAGAEAVEPVGFFQDKKKVTIAGVVLAFVVVLLIVLVVTKKPATPDASLTAAAKPEVSKEAATPVDSKSVETKLVEAKPAEPVNVDPAKPIDAAAKPAEPPKADGTETAKIDPAKPAVVEAGKPTAPDATKNGVKPADPAVAKPAEPPKTEVPPGVVNLNISPWGEVFINGRSRGVSPPTKQLKLPPGKYKVEIKNTTFPTYSEAIEVKSREEIAVRHKF